MNTLQERLYILHGVSTLQEAVNRIDALEAENAALRSDFTALQHAIVGDTGASAILTVEALRVDAERYRWLEQDFSPMGLNIDGNHAWAYRRNATLKGPTLSAAIDAARRKT